jgi:hypothetical protein
VLWSLDCHALVAFLVGMVISSGRRFVGGNPAGALERAIVIEPSSGCLTCRVGVVATVWMILEWWMGEEIFVGKSVAALGGSEVSLLCAPTITITSKSRRGMLQPCCRYRQRVIDDDVDGWDVDVQSHM